MRWILLWFVLTAVYLAIDLPLRALGREPWPPDRAAVLAYLLVPLLQVAALRFVRWMRRNSG